MEKTSDILNRAAEVMMEKGHGKGDYFVDGRPCLLGACLAAKGIQHASVTDPELYFLVLRAEEEHIAAVIGTGNIGSWNDRDETTEVMAIGVLHEASLLAKSEGD